MHKKFGSYSDLALYLGSVLHLYLHLGLALHRVWVYTQVEPKLEILDTFAFEPKISKMDESEPKPEPITTSNCNIQNIMGCIHKVITICLNN